MSHFMVAAHILCTLYRKYVQVYWRTSEAMGVLFDLQVKTTSESVLSSSTVWSDALLKNTFTWDVLETTVFLFHNPHLNTFTEIWLISILTTESFIILNKPHVKGRSSQKELWTHMHTYTQKQKHIWNAGVMCASVNELTLASGLLLPCGLLVSGALV